MKSSRHYTADWIGLAEGFIDASHGRITKEAYVELYNTVVQRFNNGEIDGMTGKEGPAVQRALYLSEQGESRAE